MAVITISRELGSEGTHIAEKVGQVLGYHVADKATLASILSEYGLTEFDRMYSSVPSFWDRLDAPRMERRNTLIGMLNQAILALAHHGDMVITGRGGFAVLGGLADVLHVRIQAPLPMRIQRVAADPALSDPGRAETIVKEHDRLQKSFVDSVYGGRWDAAPAFDLVINTGRIAPDLAVDWIVEAVRNLVVPARIDVHTTDQLNVDRILASAVADFYKCERIHAGELVGAP